MTVRQKLLLFSIAISTMLFGQHALMHSTINIDTSYTIHSALKKHLKKHPNISLASPTLKTEIKEHKDIVYRTYENHREMHLDIYSSTAFKKGNKPCIVFIHGGGWITGDKSLLKPMALSLADNGYVTITVEYRFSTEAIYPAAPIDIHSALKWIYKNASSYSIDKKRISIAGSSAGGQLATLEGVTCNKDIYNDKTFLPRVKPRIYSIIDIDGVIAFIHPLSQEGGKPGKPGAATKWFGIHFKEDSTKWIEASPLTHVGKETPPTLFIASSYPRFNAGREDMIQIMNKYNIYNDTHTFEDAPHSFWLFNPWYEPTVKYIIDFLEKTNKK